MRPLRLTMTAFGPYAGTEVVDFDALAGLGLFVVAGKNGSGKSTIFDALHYALYGTLPGRRASYIRLKSDHAGPHAECSVTLDFAAHGKQWRVVRSPKQQRPKRRGTGVTEAPAAATLFRLEQGAPVAVTNRLDEVRGQCAELVGLSGRQFERVALLPQGEFSRVLSESGTERRELLRTLFSSEIFGDAATLLTDQAAEATAADRALLDRLDHRQATLTQELSTLTGASIQATPAAMCAAIDGYRDGRLSTDAASVAELESEANRAAQILQAAVETCQRLERRVRVQAQLDDHHRNSEQHELDLARLRHARSAVPVTSNARSLGQHEQHLVTARDRTTTIHHRLNQALATAGLEELNVVSEPELDRCETTVERLKLLLADRQAAAATRRDLENLVNRVQAELRRLGNEINGLGERYHLARTRLRQANAELGRLTAVPDLEQTELMVRTADAQLAQRIELAETEREHDRAVRSLTELDANIDTLELARDAAVQAQATLVALQNRADAAFADYEESVRRHDAAVRYRARTGALAKARADLDRARSHADRLWDAFIAGTAARVAEALVADQPCPVCGSAEHPEPARHESDVTSVTQADVTTARERADSMQHTLRTIEADIEQLRATDADITSLSPTELAAQVTTTKAMALGARTLADESRQAAAQYEHVANELAAAQNNRRDLDAELRILDQRRNRLQGALGDLANETVASLQANAAAAAQTRADAEQLTTRRAELQSTITDAEQDLETIGLAQIAADNRRASTQDQLVERQAELDASETELGKLDHQLREATTPEQAVAMIAAGDFERQAQAARRAGELIGRARTARALEHDASEAVRRSQSILDERLSQSPFATLDAAMAAYIEPGLIEQLEAQTSAYIATDERLQGQLHELADLPDAAPDLAGLRIHAEQTAKAFTEANRSFIAISTTLDRIEADLAGIEQARNTRQSADQGTRRLERVAALVKGDNDRNTSLENWVLAAHLRDVVELANIRLARSTHQRFQLCVLDDGENRRGTWGLDLGVEDTVTGTRRPTAGLSGGELFQASLALALGLADAVMNQTAGVRIDALFIDEGFGSLDEASVERAIDLLDELRDRGAMVGVITHVPALLDALPRGVSVIETADGHGSTIRQTPLAA